MSYTKINTGTSPNSGDGDNLREAFEKINETIDELDNSSNYEVTRPILKKTLTTITHNKTKKCIQAIYEDDDGFIQILMVKNAVDLNSVEIYSFVEITSREITLTF